MNEVEVARLRRLRESALRSRAIACAMVVNRHAWNEPLLLDGALSCWRIARAVSGKLRAHPDVRCQADAGIAMRLRHRVLATLRLFGGATRSQMLNEYLILMRHLLRQLDDARSLTLSPDLSDIFGRCQSEINVLIDRLAREAGSRLQVFCPRGRDCPIGKHGDRPLVPRYEGEWPYMSSAPRLMSPACAAPGCRSSTIV
jgi:hypothetical protein